MHPFPSRSNHSLALPHWAVHRPGLAIEEAISFLLSSKSTHKHPGEDSHRVYHKTYRSLNGEEMLFHGYIVISQPEQLGGFLIHLRSQPTGNITHSESVEHTPQSPFSGTLGCEYIDKKTEEASGPPSSWVS